MKDLKFLIIFILFLSGCTISFTNVSTHGSAADLIDNDQETDADISPNLHIPAI